MTNLFAQAKAKPVAKGKAAKDAEPKIGTPGLEAYAYVDALEKQCKALKETMGSDIHNVMFDHFVTNKGENYKGEEKTASASLELRKRSSISKLSDSEVELLESNNVSVERIEGDFKLNTKGLTEKKLQEVSDALSKIKGLPADFIQFDASKARVVTTEASIDEVFKINDPETIRLLLPVVGTPAIKPKTSAKIKDIFSAVAKMLQED